MFLVRQYHIGFTNRVEPLPTVDTYNKTMAQYEPFDTEVEARGETLLAIEQALSRFSDEYQELVSQAMAEYDIEDPDPDGWYPQQAELNTLETIANELEPHIIDRLGEQIPDFAEWPNNITDVESALRSINEAYHLNHRGGEIGHYEFEKTDDRSGKVHCRNPYPCVFDRGLIRAVAQEYAPIESFVFVEEQGDECRRRGADSCTYTVHW